MPPVQPRFSLLELIPVLVTEFPLDDVIEMDALRWDPNATFDLLMCVVRAHRIARMFRQDRKNRIKTSLFDAADKFINSLVRKQVEAGINLVVFPDSVKVPLESFRPFLGNARWMCKQR